MQKWMSETRAQFEEKRKHFNLLEKKYNKIKKPILMKLTKNNSYDGIYLNQNELISSGKVVLGQIVQANALLYKSGKFNSPAVALYSEDPYFEEHFDALQELAETLYDFKDEMVEDPEIEEFSNLLSNEMSVLFNAQLPMKLTNNRVVYFTTIMIHREQLPEKYLKQDFFPMLVNPSRTKMSMILPSKYWSKEWVESWLNA